MAGPVLNGPFRMPMFRDFVPRRLQPWIYVCIAICFQLSGGVYLGALNEMIGGWSVVREDITMCMYANLAGMALYFPLLFRMKFRFTNKTLLLTSSFMVILCNWAALYALTLPLLWLICFVEGCFKIQGTFECMSNIQLWMTPKRDFTVFFPLLHIIILCSIQASDLLTTWFVHHANWTYMHWLIIGLQLGVFLIVFTLTRHFRIMRKFPLLGIDWLGGALWGLLALEVTFFINYGDLYDWLNSPILCRLLLVIAATAFTCVVRMFTIRHPYLEPAMWRYRHLGKLLALVTVVEAFLATEHVLEEVYYEEGMKYAGYVSASLDWLMIVGILLGCLFSLLWMKVLRLPMLRLLVVGMVALVGYLLLYYLTVSQEVNIEQLFLPTALRGFAYAVLSATMMNCLEEIMTFPHFFQALCVFNILHMFVGGALGAAFYAQGLRYFIADNFARFGASVDRVAFSAAPFHFESYMEAFAVRMEMVSVKQIYGLVVYAAITVTLALLLYDTPVRSTMKHIPNWKSVGRSLRRQFSRTRTVGQK